MYTPRAKTTLSNFKTSPLTQKYVFVRHPDIIEQDFGMTMGRIVITKHRQRAHDFYPRCIDRHQNH